MTDSKRLVSLGTTASQSGVLFAHQELAQKNIFTACSLESETLLQLGCTTLLHSSVMQIACFCLVFFFYIN